jgi:hypothetical protein
LRGIDVFGLDEFGVGVSGDGLLHGFAKKKAGEEPFEVFGFRVGGEVDVEV